MTQVTRSKDCGNSPKNELLEAFSIAVARKDLSLIGDLLAEDARWLPAGRKPVVGKDAVARAITKYAPATSLTIEHVISHGRAGAVNGYAEFGRKRRAFCHVFEFSNARGDRIEAITTYSAAAD